MPQPDHKGSIMVLNRKLLFITFIFVSLFLFGEDLIVTVEKGDTLYQISREYNVSLSSLLSYNDIGSADSLRIGQKIRIPSLSVYTVKRGDTLYGIAARAGISIDELLKLNKIDRNAILKTGETLNIPSENEAEAVATVPEDKEEISEEEKEVTAEFFWPHSGERVSMNGKLKGEEILGEKGDKIVSVSSGKVVWVAPYRGYGKLIMVEADDHHIYAYGGNEETFVKVGDRVLPGTALGSMGIDSIERNAKAYFFVYKDGKPVAPDKAPRG